MPEGINIEDLGKCDHAIRVPGCNYEVGIVKRGDHYTLLWDYYSAGGLEPKIGPNAGKIKQAYTVARVKKKARIKGYRVLEKKIDQSIRLVLTA